MSASNKKKLRNAAQTEKLTERQAAAQKEAKKLKLYTAAFVVATVILLLCAVSIGVSQIIDKSGIREKNSIAMTVGEKKITAKEMTYFYVDAVQDFYSTNSDYIAYLLDTSTPLNQQVYSSTEGTTWADYFLSIAQSNVEYVYTLCSAAEAAGYALPESEQQELDTALSMLGTYGQLYGYADANAYLQAIYGSLANEEDFASYQQAVTLANSYRASYAASLNYDAAAIEAAQADKYDNYSSFTFNSYYIAASRFLEGGTEDENGTVTYSAEEKAASVAAAEEAARSLCDASVDSVEAFDLAIAALPINADTTAQSTFYDATLYTSITATMADWLTAEHQEGDMGYVPYETTSDEGTTVNGYYVIYYIGRDDNEMKLPTVRHILLGSTDVLNGYSTYTEEDLLKYKSDAEKVLQTWKDGEKTEEAFAALAAELTIDTGSASTGGLYENITPGQMVEPFDDWCFDKHLEGDTGIVETDYGYHVMYFCGLSERSYREQLIVDELSAADLESWYADLVAKYPAELVDTTYLPLDMTLGG